MIIRFDESDLLTIDLDELSFWISSGKPSNPHAPTGARIQIGSDELWVYITPENAKRLQDNLNRAIIAQETEPDSLFDHPSVEFVKPDTRET